MIFSSTRTRNTYTATFACATCDLIIDIATEYLSTVNHFHETVLKHLDRHPQDTPPETRSTPDGNEEDTTNTITQRIGQTFYGTDEDRDAIYYDKDGVPLGARWLGDPGLAIQNLIRNRPEAGDEPPDYFRGVWNYRRP